MNLKTFFADLHIHIGRTSDGSPVKITASNNLTITNIIKECLNRKGIDIIGIVDCASPKVLKDIHKLIKQKELMELEDGGLRHKDKVTVLLASEIETSEITETGKRGVSHQIAFFPFLKQIIEFSNIMRRYISNIDLSSQRTSLSMKELYAVVDSIGGVLIPAHAFTPHKSVYGNCSPRLRQLLTPAFFESLPALELGLSADTFLADRIAELQNISFISNSDAHSLEKIGREYNIFALEKPTFKEIMLALKRQKGRKIVANYGLDPKLGKYHRTYCNHCHKVVDRPPPVFNCDQDPNHDIVIGVLDRIIEIQDYPQPVHPEHRPPYHYQIPLEFVPGIGKRTLQRLIRRFGSEMAILHQATETELRKIVNVSAHLIIKAREGKLTLEAGGGGKYGKIAKKETVTHEQLSIF